MPVNRMRMRPWLEHMIESESIMGLTWVDKNKTMFSIPWKHAARHGWELDKDASLFKKWAIHTGKYVEGQTSDPKTWKANFRCAMNSLPDIEEVKDRSVNKGHQAVRVFKMLPAPPKNKDKRCKGKATKERKKRTCIKYEKEDSEEESTQEDTFSPQENRVDSTVDTDEKDFSFEISSSDVPDWSSMVEIGGNPRFEVSPDHFTEYDDDIIKICQQLERDSTFVPSSSLNSMSFLSNEACTSPGSQWSDSSSADDIDDRAEMLQYTVLESNFSCSTEAMWKSFLDFQL